jgi:hypothetical protein
VAEENIPELVRVRLGKRERLLELICPELSGQRICG